MAIVVNAKILETWPSGNADCHSHYKNTFIKLQLWMVVIGIQIRLVGKTIANIVITQSHNNVERFTVAWIDI